MEPAVAEWVARRAKLDDQLYARYGRPLEAEHQGGFVAISDQGAVLLGDDELTLTTQAVEQFGPGAFALRRIGHEAELRAWPFTGSC